MLRSVERIALPAFDENELLKLITELCRTDGQRWLPKDKGEDGMLYCRPTMIGSGTYTHYSLLASLISNLQDPRVGVAKPLEATLCIFISLFSPPGPATEGVKLLASPSLPSLGQAHSSTATADVAMPSEALIGSNGNAASANNPASKPASAQIRAWPGGIGHAKLGANYGPTLAAQDIAQKHGYWTVLWLLEQNGEELVTEAGTTNFFIVLKPQDGGRLQLVTPSLETKLILDGVTRRSVMELARERLSDEVDVLEQDVVTMGQIAQACDEKRVVESFSVGTAAFVSPIASIHHAGRDLELGKTWKYAPLFQRWMEDIMYGRKESEWGYVIEE